MKLTNVPGQPSVGGKMLDTISELPGFAADKAGQAWGTAKKRGAKTAQRMNIVAEASFSTCDDKWMMLARTGIPAAGKAIWMILVPQPSEILEEVIQPKGGRGDPRTRRDKKRRKRRGKNGKSRKRFRGIIPNTNALIAAVIPGAARSNARIPGPIEGAAWWAWDRLELVAYWMLVLSAWDRFIYEWSSGIMEARFCQNEQNFVYSATWTEDSVQGSLAWTDDAIFTIAAQRSVTQSPSSLFLTNVVLSEVKGATALNTQGSVTARRDDETVTVTSRIWKRDPVTNDPVLLDDRKEDLGPFDQSEEFQINTRGQAEFENTDELLYRVHVLSKVDGWNYAVFFIQGQLDLMASDRA